jgi:hypothetical protein
MCPTPTNVAQTGHTDFINTDYENAGTQRTQLNEGTFQKCRRCFKKVVDVSKMSQMFQKCRRCFKNVVDVSKMSQMFQKSHRCFKNVADVSKMS